jgi:hypothetical protein
MELMMLYQLKRLLVIRLCQKILRYGVLGRIRENGHLGSLVPIHLQELATLQQHVLKYLFLKLTEYAVSLADLVQIFNADLATCPVVSE